MPMIEAYENTSAPDDQGWFSTLRSDNVYSSLIGIPMAGVEASTMYDIKSVETQYMNLECPVVNNKNWIIYMNYTDGSLLGTGAYMFSTDNMTARVNAGRFVKKPCSFIYESFGGTNMSICNIRTTYVEMDISCGTTTLCAVSEMRRSRLDHSSPAFTLIDNYRQGWTIFSYDFQTSLKGLPSYPTAVLTYLMDPNDPLGSIESPTSNKELPLPTKSEYEVRLGQLMNTYWTVINGFHAITGGMTTETAWMKGTTFSDPYDEYFLANSSTTHGRKSEDVPIIVCHLPWFIVLCISSLVMVVASLVHPLFRFFFTTAPDLMLNISSLATKNNPYFAAPSNGTFMAASDRERLLKNVKVRFGDVDPSGGVGTLAIGSLDPPGSYSIARVHKKRRYR